MKTFLFIFLTGYAVSGDNNYYVIRMPETIQQKEFKVYWNVPTMQCKSKNIPFDDLYKDYGIIQNKDDVYRGDKIAILYDPGNFPALIKNASTGEIRYRNGGVPQEGDLMDHLQNFKKEMDNSLPDKDFSGIGIIDFESWRPILRQNFGNLTPYKDVSFDIEKRRHWWWKKQWIEEEAKRRFDAAGRDFMQTTISLAKKLRPKALWGYYGYPQCFNRPSNSNPEKCADDLPGENDRIPWLWEESTALFPSVYSSTNVSAKRLAAFIRGRIKESERVRQKGTPILPYWWFRYRDGGYFRQEDLQASFSAFHNSNASGFIIWGSSKDVNTKEKCIKLKKYVTNTLGPAVAKFTKAMRGLNDEMEETNQIVFKPETVTEIDPEYYWVPPENYTSNIEHIVEEELKNKKEKEQNADGNILIDIILNRIANFCLTNCDNLRDVKLESSTVLTTKNPFPETTPKTTTTAKISVETSTERHEIILNDYSETSTVLNALFNNSTVSESNELSTTNVNDDNNTFTDLTTDSNSLEISTEKFKDIESTVHSTETNSISENSSTTNYINTTDGTNDKNTTVSTSDEINASIFNLSTTRMPKLNKVNNIVNSNSVTSEPTFSVFDTSTDNSSSEDIKITNLSDTSTSNFPTTTTTSRPSAINWRSFYADLLNLSNLVKKGFGVTETNDVESTGATEMDQVVVSVV